MKIKKTITEAARLLQDIMAMSGVIMGTMTVAFFSIHYAVCFAKLEFLDFYWEILRVSMAASLFTGIIAGTKFYLSEKK